MQVDSEKLLKMVRRAGVFFFLALAVALMACSTSLGPSINVPRVLPRKDVASSTQTGFVFIEEFVDARPSGEMVRFENQTAQPVGSIGRSATTALSEALKKSGYQIDDSAPLIITGQVKEWSADITGDFPSRMESKASIYLEVFDPANKRIYSGTYNGQATLQQSGLDNEEMTVSLADAMSEAINQVLKDQRLMTLLGSF